MTRTLTVIQPDSYDFYININFFTAATEPDFYERRKLPTHQTHFEFNNLSCWIPKESVLRNIHYDSFTHWQALLLCWLIKISGLSPNHDCYLNSSSPLLSQKLIKSVVTKEFQKNYFKAHNITTLRLIIPFSISNIWLSLKDSECKAFGGVVYYILEFFVCQFKRINQSWYIQELRIYRANQVSQTSLIVRYLFCREFKLGCLFIQKTLTANDIFSPLLYRWLNWKEQTYQSMPTAIASFRTLMCLSSASLFFLFSITCHP